jgi:hypothetical protein
MKKFFTVLFVTLGVIFFALLIALAYLWFVDPFELRPLLSAYQNEEVKPVGTSESESVATSEADSAPVSDTSDKNPNLTPAQEDALEIIGINPSGLPDTITPEQMSCFVRVLGQARVNEIQSGAAPSAIEIFKAKECL